VLYALIPTDIFASGGPSADYLFRHPFGRIPAFEHGDVRLYEAGAITRYVGDVVPGPPLQPPSPQLRARSHQIISILDLYAYWSLAWDIYVERVSKVAEGQAPDEEAIRLALPRAATCLSGLSDIMGDSVFLTGRDISLGRSPCCSHLCLFLADARGARTPGALRKPSSVVESDGKPSQLCGHTVSRGNGTMHVQRARCGPKRCWAVRITGEELQ